MNRTDKRILFGVALLILVFAILEVTAPAPVDWSLSYSRYHRKPYGTALVYERLGDLFPSLRAVHTPIIDPTRSTYALEGPVCSRIFINTWSNFDQTSAHSLLQRVEQGDHLFIAAESIAGALADTLRLDMARHGGAGLGHTDLRPIGKALPVQGSFRYDRGFPGSHFTRYDSSRTRVLAVDGTASPVLLQISWGKGRIVLSSTPRAFTNYNLLKGQNAAYMQAAFSTLPKLPVVWDEHFKVGRMESRTPMRYILSQPALRWAWFLALGLILLWFAIHTRRLQRAIPILIAPRNATGDLANTIGRMYWQRGDHADLARKMVAHFKEDVRQRTYLRQFNWDKATTEHLASKSGMDSTTMQQQLDQIQHYENAGRVSESELLALSRTLHQIRQLIH